LEKPTTDVQQVFRAMVQNDPLAQGIPDSGLNRAADGAFFAPHFLGPIFEDMNPQARPLSSSIQDLCDPIGGVVRSNDH
jgi:hypothetical protein